MSENRVKPFTHDEMQLLVQQIAQETALKTAHRVVNELFEKLDVDVTDPTARMSLRDDLRFTHDQRIGQEMLRQTIKKGALYFLGTALMGLTYLSWESIKLGVVTWVQNIR